MKRLALALLLALGIIEPALAQLPPPVPALPDAERRISYSISGTTCACSIPFALFGTSTDVDAWVEVWIAGVKYLSTDPTHGWVISSVTGPLASIPRPITNGVLTFNQVQTGTVQIVGAERPRRLSQFTNNAPVAARDLNLAFTDLVAQNRETWDKTNDVTGRALLGLPGETITQLPSATARASSILGFNGSGNPIAISPSIGTGTVIGPNSSIDGHVAVFSGITGQMIKDGGPSVGTMTSVIQGNGLSFTTTPCITSCTISLSNTPTLGVSGASIGTINLAGNTSGTALITPQAAAGTPTLTLPNTSGTFAVGATAPLALNTTTGNLTINAPYGSLTANNGGIVYSGAANLAILNGTATATQMLQSGSSAAPAWSTSTWPATTTINQLLYSSSANTIAGLATCNSGLINTSGSGVPSCTPTPAIGVNGGTGGQVVLNGATSGNVTVAVPAAIGSSVNFTLPSSNGSAGQLLKTDGAGNSSWVTASGTGTVTNIVAGNGLTGGTITTTGTIALASGNRVLLATLTASSSATISDTSSLTATYSRYVLVFENLVPATNTVTMELQIHSGGTFQATSYLATATLTNIGAALASISPTTFIPLSNTNVANTGQGLSGEVYIESPSGTTTPKIMMGSLAYPQSASNGGRADIMGWWNGGNGAVDGFQVLASSGNLTSGTIKIYGIVN